MGSLRTESDSWVCSHEGDPEAETPATDEEMSRIVNESDDGAVTKKKVLLEGFVEDCYEDDLKRMKSLTDDDLEELKGCLDLGFGFSYEEIPELCNTLPALELCYSMSQKFLDDQQNHQNSPEGASPAPESPTGMETTISPVANWKISSPGDDPDDVKARLKFWAQAVACTVKLCN